MREWRRFDCLVDALMPELFRPFRAPRGERRAMPMGPSALVGCLLVEPEPELTCKLRDQPAGEA